VQLPDLLSAVEVHGVPISLQLVGRRFEDEKVLRILEEITLKIGLPFEKFP
jgi:amidase